METRKWILWLGKNSVLTYFQVTADMTAEETFHREMRPLQEIRDNYEKIVLTLDYFTAGNYEGIQVVNILNWLCSKFCISMDDC